MAGRRVVRLRTVGHSSSLILCDQNGKLFSRQARPPRWNAEHPRRASPPAKRPISDSSQSVTARRPLYLDVESDIMRYGSCLAAAPPMLPSHRTTSRSGYNPSVGGVVPQCLGATVETRSVANPRRSNHHVDVAMRFSTCVFERRGGRRRRRGSRLTSCPPPPWDSPARQPPATA